MFNWNGLTVTVLSLAVVVLLIEVIVLRCRGRTDSFLLAHVRVLGVLVCRVVHGLRAVTFSFDGSAVDPIPGTGACLVVANHRSGADPVFLSVITRRNIRFMMAREYYEVPALTWLFRALGCIPVNRDGHDLSATKTTLKLLRDGRCVGIFPQGGIQSDEELVADAGKEGAALFALKTATPVIPFYIDGSPALQNVFAAVFFPSRTRVYCGTPLILTEKPIRPTRENLTEATERIIDAIASLRPLRVTETPRERVPQEAERVS